MDTNGPVGRRNRRWSDGLKQEIVAVCLEPGASVSVVARRYDVNANQVFGWRKLYRERLGSSGRSSGPVLVPVSITDDGASVASTLATQTEAIEITLRGGYSIRLGAGFDAHALKRVLDVLERRTVRRSPGEDR
jgi:transposase